MSKRFEYINNLLAYYEILLPVRQKETLQYYYYDDLSLSEIAENLNISRNAVYDSLKKGEKSLEAYEEKLHLYADAQFRLNKYQALQQDCSAEEVQEIVKELIAKEEEQ